MRLIDLANKCGAEVKDIVRTIEVQFNDSLPHGPNPHVPDKYISRILYMYETLQPDLFNKDYSQMPAKTFGEGNGNLIKLNKIAKDLNIGVSTIVEAFSHIFQGNSNPNSRVSVEIAIQICNYFGKDYNSYDFTKDPIASECNIKNSIEDSPECERETEGVDYIKLDNDSDALIESEENNQPECFCSIARLSMMLGIAEGRVRNILAWFGYKDNLDSTEEIITYNHWRKIIDDFNSCALHLPPSFRKGGLPQKNKILGLNKLIKPNLTKNLQSAYDFNRITEAKITSINAGGYVMTSLEDDNNLLFCPYSQSVASVSESKFCKKLIGSNWFVMVKSDPSDNPRNVIVSARLNKDFYKGMIKEGDYYEAFICNRNETGAFLLIEKCIPVFVPNELISWRNGSKALTDLELGKFVVVKIIKADKGLIASIRDAYNDPWVLVSNKYPIGTVVDAKINYIKEGFIRLDMGEYKGHLPASEISWTEPFIPDCSKIDILDPLRLVVTGHHHDTQTIQLSLKRLTPDPWMNLNGYIPEDGVMDAIITELTNSGAWLKVGNVGFKGYLSYRDVDWCNYIEKDNFPHSIGSKIRIKITHRNKDRRQLTCSKKALIPNPWEALTGRESVEGIVTKIYSDYAAVCIDGGIECVCREMLNPDYEGQRLTFDILQLNVSAQQIVISLRKQELVELNTMAVGEMFKEFRNLTDVEKELSSEIGNDKCCEIHRHFTIKEISSTGRVMAIYAEDDGEYENGILLPGSVHMNGFPVNVIFARQIIRQYLKPGETHEFKVTHRYTNFNYAVLSIDAADLLDLNNIAIDDMNTLTSFKGVEANVLHSLCTNRNIFVQWKGYFGYIPKVELAEMHYEIPGHVRVKAVVKPQHPGQMIRFTVLRQEEEDVQIQEQTENDLIEQLDTDLRDCYDEMNRLDGFDQSLPDYYPYALQIRYTPQKHTELAELLLSDPTYFSSQTFFLDCFSGKDNNGYVLSIFNNNISITAFCSERNDGDEIRISRFNPDAAESPERGKHFGKPLRIAGENIQIVPLNSSAMPPAQQDIDIILSLLKYNRDVLPELRKLSRVGLQKRGEHFLTLKELLEMDLNRETALCSTDVKVKGPVKEVAGTLGGYGIEFEAAQDCFDTITCKDDSIDGMKVIIKPHYNEPFMDRQPSGFLKYLGHDRWIVELFPNRDVDVDSLNKLGIQIKRYPNIRHLKRQIQAIDNFVYERNGLDIFSKIARKKLNSVEMPDIETIEANPHFNLMDPTDSQVNALKMALGGSQITLIQGPPGTGKSTVIVDIIRNLVKRHKKVLVCTQSVAPVEELYYKLSGRKDGRIVNVPVTSDGIPLRCAYLRDDESIEISGSVEERRRALKEMMLYVKKLQEANSSINESIIADLKKLKESLEEIQKDCCGEVARKFNRDIAPHCDEVLDILREYHEALDKEDVENFTTEHRSLNLEAVDVVFGTCIGVGVNPLLRDLHFDMLIIDEAGKANYSESLVPMMMADEYILVGDDKQLPPYTNSELVKELAANRLKDSAVATGTENFDHNIIDSEIENIMEDVGKSLFGDLRPRLPQSNQIMLSRQFRMHPEIGDFVSKLFYEGKVNSVPKPEDRTLNIPGLENSIRFIDTTGMGAEARECRLGRSLYNEGEIRVIEEELLPMLESALDSGRSVGILSPYGAQVMKIRERIPKLQKHVFTIDSIQGEEYDIVVFSFVRNTRVGSLNFVDDLRRLNVSFSRAKCNLIMIGHLETLKNESLHKIDKETVMSIYKEIEDKKVDYVAHHGAMQRLYDDFPPNSCQIIDNLDNPYHVFEDCRLTHKGQFTSFYKGKLLTLYNPVLTNIVTNSYRESFRSSLIGYQDEKPLTMIEPIGHWLSAQKTLKDFRFTATVESVGQSNITLKLIDKSMITLDVPKSIQFFIGNMVEVKVRNNKYFTVKPIDHE